MFESLSRFVPFILIPFIGWGLRKRLIKREEYTSLRKATLFIGLSAFFLTEAARSFYRPYIYKYDLNDFYIADTIGNSLGTVTAIFMILLLSGKGSFRDWKIIVMVSVGLIIYELLNPVFHNSIDIRDIIATLIFSIFSTVLYFYLIQKLSHAKIHRIED